jgi:aldehyde dehydrogenase (NAD+)
MGIVEDSIVHLPAKEVVDKARAAYASGKTRPLSFRRAQLNNFRRMFEECADEMLDALRKDLRKARNEAALYEVDLTKQEIIAMLRDLDKYAAKEHLPLNLLASLDRGYIQREPYGVVLILGAWNYPFLLSCKPMIGAIAAGNAVILKPSECSPHSAEVMFRIIPRYLDKECYQIFTGDVTATKEMLKHKFDYIFCTGSPAVGKSVYQDAALHLTPCTLELGGKSPCYVDESANFYLAAKRVLWAKFVNLGQTCIAPDYLLCSKNAEKEFIRVASEVIDEWYGKDWQGNPDMPRIVNKRNFLRLKTMLDKTKGKIAFGGKSDIEDLWIEPTLVGDVEMDDALMQEEIFGPILPIVNVNSVDEAIKKILSKPKPLALYTFANNDEMNNKLINEVSSGSVCVNDCIWQNAWVGLPFGGVGDSGMGQYHGKFSFDTFSHKKSVLRRGFSLLSEKLGESRYPPYTEGKLKMMRFILSSFHVFNVECGGVLTHLVALLSGGLIVFLYFVLIHDKWW